MNIKDIKGIKDYKRGSNPEVYLVYSRLLDRAFGDSYKKTHKYSEDIDVCLEWYNSFTSFEEFYNKEKKRLADLGIDIKGLYLTTKVFSDDGVYCSDNCCFIDKITMNFFTNRKNGKALEDIGISYNDIKCRWSVIVNYFADKYNILYPEGSIEDKNRIAGLAYNKPKSTVRYFRTKKEASEFYKLHRKKQAEKVKEYLLSKYKIKLL